MFQRYSDTARQAVFVAWQQANAAASAGIDTDHMIGAILVVDPDLPERMAVAFKPTPMPAPVNLTTVVSSDSGLPVTPELHQAIAEATALADQHGCEQVRTEHLFAAMLSGDDKVAALNALSRLDCHQPQKLTAAAKVAAANIANQFSQGSP